VKLLTPSTEGIVPIGDKYMSESLKKTFNAEFIDTLTRKPSVFRGGIPFQVEIGIAYGGESGRATDEGRKMEIMRFANKAPLLFDTGACGITKAIKSINWKNYNVGDIENSPITVFVNVVSPHIPYKSAGKQSVDDDDDIIREIRFAIMDISRRLKRYLSGVRQEQIKVKRRSMFIKYAPEVAWALSVLTGKSKEKILADLVEVVQKRVKLKEEQEAKLGEEKSKDEMDLPLEKVSPGNKD
jgi:DNA topoisomerase-6 subunit B